MADWVSPDVYSGERHPNGLLFPIFEVAVVDTSLNRLPVFRHYFTDIELADTYRNTVPLPRYFTVEFMKLHKFGRWREYRDTWDIWNNLLRKSKTTDERAYQQITREVHERMQKLTEAYCCDCHYHKERPVVGIRKTSFNRAFKEAFHCYKDEACSKHERCFWSTRVEYSFIRHMVRDHIRTGKLEPLLEPIDSLQRLCIDVVRANKTPIDLAKQFPDHCRLKQMIFLKIQR